MGRILLVTRTGVSSGLEVGRLLVAGTRVLLEVGSLSVSAVSLVVRGSSLDVGVTVTISPVVRVILESLAVGVTLTPSLVELAVDVLMTDVGVVGSRHSVMDRLKRASVNSSSL